MLDKIFFDYTLKYTSISTCSRFITYIQIKIDLIFLSDCLSSFRTNNRYKYIYVYKHITFSKGSKNQRLPENVHV